MSRLTPKRTRVETQSITTRRIRKFQPPPDGRTRLSTAATTTEATRGTTRAVARRSFDKPGRRFQPTFGSSAWSWMVGVGPLGPTLGPGSSRTRPSTGPSTPGSLCSSSPAPAGRPVTCHLLGWTFRRSFTSSTLANWEHISTNKITTRAQFHADSDGLCTPLPIKFTYRFRCSCPPRIKPPGNVGIPTGGRRGDNRSISSRSCGAAFWRLRMWSRSTATEELQCTTPWVEIASTTKRITATMIQRE